MQLEDLKNPFPAEDIEWRIQQSGFKNGKPWAMVLAYVTARAIMDRLDEVCEPQNWKNEFAPGPDGGVLCGLSIRIDDEWVTKWDGAENTDIESVKGGLSSATKRAAVHWGIGRYLYNLDTGFANIHANGKYRGAAKDKESGKSEYFKWDPPTLPNWANTFPRKTVAAALAERELVDMEEARKKTDELLERYTPLLHDSVLDSFRVDIAAAKSVEDMRNIYGELKKQGKAVERQEGKAREEERRHKTTELADEAEPVLPDGDGPGLF